MTAAPPISANTSAAPPDAALLQSWAHRRDEDAFRMLAERHFARVIATAQRCTGQDAMAQEAAQSVLTILARKAASLEHAPLVPWLHRTTVLECRALLRRESRHHRRTLALAAEPVSAPGVPEDAAWQDAVPVLDEAIDRLGDADRRVLMLRFFDGLSFREIAGRIGKSEAAAQRQGHRALERLGGLLRGKGVLLSSTTLAAGLTTVAPPAGVSAGVVIADVLAAAVPQQGAAAVLVHTFHTMSRTKIALTTAAAVTLLTAIPLALQWRENGRLSRALAAAESRLAAHDQKPERTGSGSRTAAALPERASAAPAPNATDAAAAGPTDLLMGAGEKDVSTRLAARLEQLRERLRLRADQEPALQKAAEARRTAVLDAFKRIRQNKAVPPDMGILTEWSLGAMPLAIDSLLDAGQAAAYRELQTAEHTGRVESMTNVELIEMQSQGALHLTAVQKDAAFAALSAIIAEEDAAGPDYYADDGRFTDRVSASLQRRREAMETVLDASQQTEYARMLDEDFTQVLTMFPPSR